MKTQHPLVSALKKHPKFATLIKKYGPLKISRGSNPFKALVRSIIHQQLSGKAAETIFKRFVLLFKNKGKMKFPTPEMLRDISVEELRTAGVSRQKASYLHDVAEKFCADTSGKQNMKLTNRSFNTMSNDEIMQHLLQIKGVGEWTVHMFLIFTLNRPDVLPVGDLGIRKGFQILYQLKNVPDKKKMQELAKPWREHATLASRYLWQLADEAKGEN